MNQMKHTNNNNTALFIIVHVKKKVMNTKINNLLIKSFSFECQKIEKKTKLQQR